MHATFIKITPRFSYLTCTKVIPKVKDIMHKKSELCYTPGSNVVSTWGVLGYNRCCGVLSVDIAE